MNQERKPWLFLKRLERWSPLAAVRPMLAPAPSESVEPAPEPLRKDRM